MSSEESGSSARRREDAIFLDNIINRFLRAPMKLNESGEPTAEIQVSVTHEEIYRLCHHAVESFKEQPALLQIQPNYLPLTVCGDIHGQLRDVRLIVDQFGTMDRHNYLFMGDYVDRGLQGIETLCFLLANKTRYPQRCFLLRGNHEDYNTSMIYGLLDECFQKYGNILGQRVWLSLINACNHMPFAAVVADKILALHGGISPHLRHLNDINKIPRPTVIPLYGLACDLVWADPSMLHTDWALSPRGVSFTFSEAVADKFCQQNGLDLIVRGHQIFNEMHGTGYQFGPNHRVLTLFTASDYLKAQNTGAVMTIDPSLTIQFTLFRPMTKKRLLRDQNRRASKSVSNTTQDRRFPDGWLWNRINVFNFFGFLS
ncbi:SER-THR-PHOSPHATASE domain-containing protein [Aphelenchoides bicaudatus]|nr:SER-THR-PHOSPHATASE domain-containing protein [Aphelenchoides bicaudatus]